jgi:hypothetical protein
VRSNPSKLTSLTRGPEYRIHLTADQGLRQIPLDPGSSIQYRHMQELDVLEAFARLEMQPAGERHEIRTLEVLRSLGAAKVDGKVDHCGTDLSNLVRQDGKGLIASVADTGRKGLSGEVVAADSFRVA